MLADSRLIDVAGVEQSLIGREVEVLGSGTHPRAYRLMLGDHARVEVL